MLIQKYNGGKKVKTWAGLTKAYAFFYEKDPQRNYKWIFRGENYRHNCSIDLDLKEALRSSLDKAFQRFDIAEERRNKYEQAIARSFGRKAHLYSGNKISELLESLALLRHFEGPSRMLDWEYSFFIGVFFAVVRAEAGENLAIWALNNDWLAKRNKESEEGKVNPAADPAVQSNKVLKYLMDHNRRSTI